MSSRNGMFHWVAITRGLGSVSRPNPGKIKIRTMRSLLQSESALQFRTRHTISYIIYHLPQPTGLELIGAKVCFGINLVNNDLHTTAIFNWKPQTILTRTCWESNEENLLCFHSLIFILNHTIIAFIYTHTLTNQGWPRLTKANQSMQLGTGSCTVPIYLSYSCWYTSNQLCHCDLS